MSSNILEVKTMKLKAQQLNLSVVRSKILMAEKILHHNKTLKTPIKPQGFFNKVLNKIKLFKN